MDETPPVPETLGGRNPCSPENGGWLGPALQNRVMALLSDEWIVTTANAYDVQARSEIDQARALVLDRPYRHKRKARHLAQAHQFALHARALRDLLRYRQASRPKANSNG